MGNTLDRLITYPALRQTWGIFFKQWRRSCSGVDRLSADEMHADLLRHLHRIRERIRSNYHLDGLLAVPIPREGKKTRIICVPTFADRLVQQVALQHLRPRLMAAGLDNKVSFGLVKDQGSSRSTTGARAAACTYRSKYPWVYKSDIVAFFDQIPRDELKAAVRSKLRARSIYPVLDAAIDAEITHGTKPGWQEMVRSAGIENGRGLRQGMPVSPLLAGLVLEPFDRFAIKRGFRVVRYVDDFVAFFSTEAECREFHEIASSLLGQLGLRIADINDPNSKTKIYGPDQVARFLGMDLTPPINGRCQLLVSDETMTRIASQIEGIGAIEQAVSIGLTFPSLDRYLRSIIFGYLNAYEGAHNHQRMAQVVKLEATRCRSKLLGQLFGADFLGKLPPLKRKFLGLNSAVELAT